MISIIGYVAYGVTVYLMAYLIYLLIRSASMGAGLKYQSRPYDSHHLILKR